MECENLPLSTIIVENYKIDYFLFYVSKYVFLHNNNNNVLFLYISYQYDCYIITLL